MNLIRAYAIYCGFLVSGLAIANHQGYVFSSYFSSEGKADKSANRYHK
jgi:hypothetical protein